MWCLSKPGGGAAVVVVRGGGFVFLNVQISAG